MRLTLIEGSAHDVDITILMLHYYITDTQSGSLTLSPCVQISYGQGDALLYRLLPCVKPICQREVIH